MIPAVFVVKTIFKLVAHKITCYFSQWTNILRRFVIPIILQNGLYDEIIKPPTTSDNSLAPALSYFGTKTKVKFCRGCLRQHKITYIQRTIVNVFSVYELSSNLFLLIFFFLLVNNVHKWPSKIKLKKYNFCITFR